MDAWENAGIEDLLNFSDAKNFLEANGFIVKNAVTFTNNG